MARYRLKGVLTVVLASVLAFVTLCVLPSHAFATGTNSTNDTNTSTTTTEPTSTTSSSSGEEDKDYTPPGKFDLYLASSAAAQYFDSCFNPDSAQRDEFTDDQGTRGESLGAFDSVVSKIATVGGIAGFVDFDVTDNVHSGLRGSDTRGAQSLSYSAFSNDAVRDMKIAGTNSTCEALRQYMMYGYALASTGFDETSSVVSGYFRQIVGRAAQLAYLGSGGADKVFDAVLDVLDIFNPFRLIISATGEKPLYSAGYSGEAYSVKGGVGKSGIQAMNDIISTIFYWCDVIGWLVVPLFFILLIASWAVFGATSEVVKTRGRRAVLRFLYLIVGIPLLGILYTSMLTQLKDGMFSGAARGNAGAADYVMASTFVDFQSWVSNQNLVMPEDAVIYYDESIARNAATMGGFYVGNPRAFARAINNAAWGGTKRLSASATDKGLTVVGNKESTVEYLRFDASSSGGFQSKLSRSKFATSVFNMLNAYANGETCSASTVDASAKTYFSTHDDASAARVLFDNDANGEDYKQSAWTDVDKAGDVNAYPDAFLANIFRCTPKSSKEVGTGGITFSGKVFKGNGNAEDGMSTMALYNYLNSSFSEQGVTIYSGKKSSNSYARPSHYSVVAVSSGVLEVLYLVDAFLGLLGVAIIAYGYVLGMFFANVTRTLRVVMNMSLSVTGALLYMARTVVSVLMLIVEIIMTVVLYRVATALLVSVDELFTNTLIKALQDANILSGKIDTGGATVMAAGATMDIQQTLVTFVLIFVHLAFVLVLLGVREPLMGAWNRFVESRCRRVGC